MLGVSDPVSVLLSEELAQYWGGKVVDFTSLADSLGPLAAVLNRAREQALASGEFTEVGTNWLTGTLADFCHQLRAPTTNAGFVM